jgi:DNA polymerase III delta prime subunit
LPTIVVAITGPPGSGKTTLAVPLSRALGWPPIARDTIKEALFDGLGAPDLGAAASHLDLSRRLGSASYEVLFAVAGQVPGPIVVESNFSVRSLPRLRQLGAAFPIEVFCRCPVEKALDRYRRRPRHPVHHSRTVTTDELLKLGAQEPLGLGGPLFVVDTAEAVDVRALAGVVRSAASQ